MKTWRSCPARSSRAAAAVLAAVAGAALLCGCAAGQRTLPTRTPPVTLPPAPAVPTPGNSLVRVPRPNYANPASVAAAFFTAWASTDAIHDTQSTFLGRCAPLVTPALRRQLASNQPSQAEWQAMRRAWLVSLVQVQTVTHPAGAPPPSRTVVFLRIYAQRVTTTPAGRTTTSDGGTVQLNRVRGRWLVAGILFW